MELRNYIEMVPDKKRTKQYLFVDTHNFLADQLFIKKEMEVKFLHDFTKENVGFVVVMCSCKEKEEEKFLEAMEELDRKLAVVKGRDYELFLDEFVAMFE